MKVSADYRMLALDALRGKWKTAVLTGIAASALGATIVSSSNSVVSNSNQAKDIHFELFSQPNGGRLLAVLLAGIGLWAILQLIVGGAVQLGYAHFNLNLVDGKDAAISDLFSQKDRLWDGFCMKFLQGLYIALWSLLLVIPGIVKTYSYAMTPYIMSEHPSLTANEAITESRRIMDGNKWRLFCLDFSFIGWELLCSLPLYAGGFLVLKYFTGSEAMAISLVLLLTIPLSIGFFFVRPYEEAAWATFYRDITAAPTEPDEAYLTFILFLRCDRIFRGDLRMEKKPDRSEIITMTLLFALTLVLTVLKVTRTFSLPWLWVLGPLWIGTCRYRD